jgi:N-acyl-D-aspartate/D-glutamate deacylase
VLPRRDVVVAGNCGYSIAPCARKDHEWLTELFAKVEGMSPNVLREGVPWGMGDVPLVP